jgi:hypothetical protein
MAAYTPGFHGLFLLILLSYCPIGKKAMFVGCSVRSCFAAAAIYQISNDTCTNVGYFGYFENDELMHEAQF